MGNEPIEGRYVVKGEARPRHRINWYTPEDPWWPWLAAKVEISVWLFIPFVVAIFFIGVMWGGSAAEESARRSQAEAAQPGSPAVPQSPKSAVLPATSGSSAPVPPRS